MANNSNQLSQALDEITSVKKNNLNNPRVIFHSRPIPQDYSLVYAKYLERKTNISEDSPILASFISRENFNKFSNKNKKLIKNHEIELPEDFGIYKKEAAIIIENGLSASEFVKNAIENLYIKNIKSEDLFDEQKLKAENLPETKIFYNNLAKENKLNVNLLNKLLNEKSDHDGSIKNFFNKQNNIEHIKKIQDPEYIKFFLNLFSELRIISQQSSNKKKEDSKENYELIKKVFPKVLKLEPEIIEILNKTLYFDEKTNIFHLEINYDKKNVFSKNSNLHKALPKILEFFQFDSKICNNTKIKNESSQKIHELSRLINNFKNYRDEKPLDSKQIIDVDIFKREKNLLNIQNREKNLKLMKIILQKANKNLINLEHNKYKFINDNFNNLIGDFIQRGKNNELVALNISDLFFETLEKRGFRSSINDWIGEYFLHIKNISLAKDPIVTKQENIVQINEENKFFKLMDTKEFNNFLKEYITSNYELQAENYASEIELNDKFYKALNEFFNDNEKKENFIDLLIAKQNFSLLFKENELQSIDSKESIDELTKEYESFMKQNEKLISSFLISLNNSQFYLLKNCLITNNLTINDIKDKNAKKESIISMINAYNYRNINSSNVDSENDKIIFILMLGIVFNLEMNNNLDFRNIKFHNKNEFKNISDIQDLLFYILFSVKSKYNLKNNEDCLKKTNNLPSNNLFLLNTDDLFSFLKKIIEPFELNKNNIQNKNDEEKVTGCFGCGTVKNKKNNNIKDINIDNNPLLFFNKIQGGLRKFIEYLEESLKLEMADNENEINKLKKELDKRVNTANENKASDIKDPKGSFCFNSQELSNIDLKVSNNSINNLTAAKNTNELNPFEEDQFKTDQTENQEKKLSELDQRKITLNELNIVLNEIKDLPYLKSQQVSSQLDLDSAKSAIDKKATKIHFIRISDIFKKDQQHFS